MNILSRNGRGWEGKGQVSIKGTDQIRYDFIKQKLKKKKIIKAFSFCNFIEIPTGGLSGSLPIAFPFSLSIQIIVLFMVDYDNHKIFLG